MSDLARALAELNAAPILIITAIDGLLDNLECTMPICICPSGRGYFERRGDPRYGPWAPSADRFPVPGRDGGTYSPTNIRLAHKKCNQSEGGRYGGRIGITRLSHEQLSRGGTAAATLINETWAKTPEGMAQRVRNGKKGGAKVSAARKASGQYQSPEHRERGRRLSERGLPALRAWEQTTEAHRVRSANGHQLVCLNNTRRGKPCTCGHH